MTDSSSTARRRVFVAYTAELGTAPPGGTSSVYAARAAIRDCGHEALSMEDFTADPRPAWERCRDAVLSCDVLVLLIGGRYGAQVSTGPHIGLSYTEMEFRLATEAGLARLVFLVGDGPGDRATATGLASRETGDERLTRFVAAVRNSVMAVRAQSPADLRGRLRAALDGLPPPERGARAANGHARSRWLRPLLVVLAAVALVVGTVLVLPVLDQPSDDPPSVAKVTSLTDPCALWDPSNALTGMTATVVPDYGGPAECTVMVGPVQAGLSLTPRDSTFPSPDATSTIQGPLQVTRSCSKKSCMASLIPIDASTFGVQVSTDAGSSGVGVPVLNALQQSVQQRLTSGDALAERPEPAVGSLLRTPACSLLSDAVLGEVGGLGKREPGSLFGDWSCEWGDPNAGAGRNSVVGLGYSRLRPDDFPAGCRPSDGSVTCPPDAETEDDGRSYCGVSLRGPAFTATDGTQRYDEVLVLVRAFPPRTVPQVCSDVARLAAAVARRLPG